MMKNYGVMMLAILCIVTSSFGQNVPNYVPTNGLVGWYPFNGTANDESGNGNNAEVNVETLISDRNGNENSAFYFDGVNNTIKINSIPKETFSNNQLTYSIWVNLIDLEENQQIIYINNTIALNKSGISSPNELVINDGFSHKSTVTNKSIGFLNWLNIIAVYNNDNIELYLNGVTIYKGSTWNNQPIDYDIKAILIGSNKEQSSKLNGGIDDLSIYNRVLTQQEISNLYKGRVSSNNQYDNLTPEQSYGIEPTPQDSKGGTQTIRVNPDDI
jgi:hypothetical protein